MRGPRRKIPHDEPPSPRASPKDSPLRRIWCSTAQATPRRAPDAHLRTPPGTWGPITTSRWSTPPRWPSSTRAGYLQTPAFNLSSLFPAVPAPPMPGIRRSCTTPLPTVGCSANSRVPRILSVSRCRPPLTPWAATTSTRSPPRPSPTTSNWVCGRLATTSAATSRRMRRMRSIAARCSSACPRLRSDSAARPTS